MREYHRDPEVPEERVPVVQCLDSFARITSKELAITHFVKSGTLQRPRVVVGFGEKCSYAHRLVDEQPTKRSKSNSDKSAVAMLKSTRQLGCVFQDMEPPKPILRMSSDMQKPFQRVKFTEAIARHTRIVKSIPSTTENGLRKRYKYSKKNYKSTEDKHETNHINNKYNDKNMNTRKMHNT